MKSRAIPAASPVDVLLRLLDLLGLGLGFCGLGCHLYASFSACDEETGLARETHSLKTGPKKIEGTGSHRAHLWLQRFVGRKRAGSAGIRLKEAPYLRGGWGVLLSFDQEKKAG